MKYIAFIEKKKGKYVKSEEITLNKLKDIFDKAEIHLPIYHKKSFINWLLGKNYIHKLKKEYFELGIIYMQNSFIEYAKEIIDKDKPKKKVIK